MKGGAAIYGFRTQVRRRGWAWMTMGALIGIAAGGVLAAAIGAQRTASANDRFLDVSNAFDVGVPLDCATPEGEPIEEGACLDEVRALPGVEDAVALRQLGPLLFTADGRALQPAPDDLCYSGPGSALLAADAEGRFGTEVNRIRLLDGRLPAPDAPHEVIIAPEVADRLDLHVGDTLTSYPGASCDDDLDAVEPVTLDIVGVGVAPFFARPPSGEYYNVVLASPAILDEGYAIEGAMGMVTLEDGFDGVDDFVAAATDRIGPAAADPDALLRQAGNADAVDRGLRPQAASLALVALLAAAAAVAVLGSALYRQTEVDTDDDATLAVLGLTARQRLAMSAARAGVIAAAAVVMTGVVAYLLSSSVQTGLGELVEPDPGRHLDLGPVALGLLIVAAVVTAVVVFGSGRRAARRRSARRDATRRPSRLVALASSRGWRPTVVMGLRMALERRRGVHDVPVATSLLGVIIGLTLLTGTVVFSASLQHLQDTPRLVGWNWDFGVPLGDDDPQRGTRLREALADDAAVEGTAPATFFQFIAGGIAIGTAEPIGDDGRDVALYGFGPGAVGPTIVDGRAPTSPDEIAVGPSTLRAIDADIGESVTLAVSDEAAIYAGDPARRDSRYRVVGTTLVPINGLEGRLGHGVATTLEGIRRMFPQTVEEIMWVRLDEDDRDERDRVIREAVTLTGADESEIRGLFGGELITATLVDTEGVDHVPLVLAGFLALLAAGVLAHALVTAVLARRHDLAVLRTLGFTRGQLRASVAWQAVVISGLALLVAVPLGVAAGRVAWTVYAESLGAVVEPVVPMVGLALAAVATGVAAVVVAVVPGWTASRVPAAAALRAE